MSVRRPLAVAIHGALAAALVAPVAPALAQQSTSLEEVVVTAQRREESQQKVPISVTTLSGADLERRQTVSVVDIASQVPALNGNNNVSLGGATSFFMRGIGQDESSATSDPAVGTYVDGVYIARQIGNNTYLYDVERIEVLRGPQGTLYGRNTSGGAVKIVTRKPSNEFYGYAQAGFGRFDRYEVSALANAPFSDTLYGKIQAFHLDQGKGIQRNVTLNRDIWKNEASGVRAQLRWVPNDDVDLVVSADWAKDEADPQIGRNALAVPPRDLFTIVSPLQGAFSKVEQYGLTATLDWKLTDGISLQSISAFRSLDQNYLIDFGDVPAFVGFAIPNDSTHEQWSQEFQFTGTSFGDRLEWVAGAFYMDEDNDSYFGEDIFGGLISSRKSMVNTAKSFALFTQGTYAITDRVGLTLGLRWTDEKRDLKLQGTTNFLPPITPVAATLTYDDATLRSLGIKTNLKFSEVNPKVGIDFQQTDDVLWYASYTQGFKAGGWNSRVTAPGDFVNFDPETVDSYEVGVKSEWFDNRVRANLNYFIAKYKDFIITALNPLTGGFVTVNAAKMETKGLEGEFQFQATEDLNVFFAFATLDGEYKKLDVGVPVPITNKPKRIPKASYNFGFNWKLPQNFGLSMVFSHQDEYYNGFANTANELAPAQDILNATLDWHTADNSLALSAGCRNCTDDIYFHSTLDFSALGFATQFPGMPRTWNVTARYNFGAK